MTDVKICGLMREEDVGLACELGASYLGFNFAADSPRRLTPARAAELARAAAPRVLRVGVFVGEGPAEMLEAIAAVGLDLVQIHRGLRSGDLDLPVSVVAVGRVSSGGVDAPLPELLRRCRAFLLDTASPGRAGGSGSCFDWSLLHGRVWPVPLILAGGLNPGNVRSAIARVRPAAVDVASGVESSPGIKDGALLREFFAEVRRADGDGG
jgi:phosphoribosylanthranilate isomerase